ncbi:MAG TPA: phosphate acyltransferase PlsX [Thermoclostridium caenicola]|uniref:Phosphate acyltransferase n=1 Tax=Thermoclostridium caenicola TaxID=659425 RepID=A0A1M6FU33_9FIRM|nr:phosphate acyltransferase PlsX [Thermoclostridium caenicola]SHJ01212.1 phosphate:acyl-[acyl carrier protein] acyltransferase [Thermoclostridium caenicola]HOK42272.1 phosphate acyltransferase PlsX [Thermoclostridium caenicola]HOP72915.1 phosphate acyltransferase PlsX [Thermoclostridium caenicola]HPO76751.1 phosphate acyltransferase PlsX [Thermoclostridium caenicola]HPU21937.1 phosphate acyltransferase PlsX [Thermoclostridium caenicola]
MRIIVDAMGGDNAPDEVVKGCLEALSVNKQVEIELVGDRKKIEKCLKNCSYDASRLFITDAREEITNNDVPTEAIKKKQNSSIVIGLKKMKNKEGDAFISAGSTGALLAGSLLITGRMKGVHRPALAPVVPSEGGRNTMIIDAGMNTQVKPINYMQFGIMGAEYMKHMFGLESPRVGLVNVGTEEKKGNHQLHQAYQLLKNSNLNFIGNVEGRDITDGKVDVAVCDGLTGNAMLKVMEGTGRFFMDYLKRIYSMSLASKISFLMVRHELKKLKKQIDPEEVGGTPILGVNGIIYKCHGNSKAKAFKNTILKACSSACVTVLEQIRNIFAKMDLGGAYDEAL